MNDFIEFEDGTVVDGTTAENIRARFQDVFAEQKKSFERIHNMPQSWGQASITFKKFLIREVYEAVSIYALVRQRLEGAFPCHPGVFKLAQGTEGEGGKDQGQGREGRGL
jgi:hypothetical protein